MQSNEIIINTLTKKNRSRRSSISSTSTGGNTGTKGKETLQINIGDPAITQAYEELNDDGNPQGQVIIAIHHLYMDTLKTKRYVKRTIQATKAAMEFSDHVKTTLAELDEREDGAQQPTLDNLARLNPGLITNIYIGLNKGPKKTKYKGKGKAITPNTRANTETPVSSSPKINRPQRDGASTGPSRQTSLDRQVLTMGVDLEEIILSLG
ncbi:hypothetical protein FSARC_5948 [Fusarium sarcochroum]|uniref:Uncharacterized protein n=1 Tax=Fusarium sarcochroum TaxID=1208366 RepID=A0A8H4X905_9HYPO|nr:hypothetical protein FSARC_5948 [Fusarium sarcochroum]